ncbi:MAG: hypothetical protein WCO69_01075 [Candidatus Omnitrophota bacterium]
MRPVVKILLVLAALTVSGLLLYWVKCQLGVNVIDGFRWEDRIPALEVFQKHIKIVHPKPGEELFTATFENEVALKPWWKAYVLGKGLVGERLSLEGRGGSKALEMANLSELFWVKEYDHWVGVKPGEVFAYQGYCRFPAGATEKRRAFMGIALHDAARKPVKWNAAESTVTAAGGADWQELSGRLVVPEGVALIRFRISGDQQGPILFDDIRLWREK